MPAFARQEYRERTARLRKRMAERCIDALLAQNEANRNHLTDYNDIRNPFRSSPLCVRTRKIRG